jgi:hypothetical protein
VTVTGIHVHVGSGVMEPNVWLETANKICALILDLTDQDQVRQRKKEGGKTTRCSSVLWWRCSHVFFFFCWCCIFFK